MARTCQVRGGLACGFVSTLALSLEPGALRPRQTVGLGENAFLSHPGVGGRCACLSPVPRPSIPTAGLPAGAHKGARAAEPLLQLILEKGLEVMCVFSPWRSCSLKPNISAQGSTKLTEIDFSQGSRNGRRGQGLKPCSFQQISTGHVLYPGGGDDRFLEGMASCHFLPPEIPDDSTWTSVLIQGGTAGRRSYVRRKASIITSKNGSWVVKLIIPGQE